MGIGLSANITMAAEALAREPRLSSQTKPRQEMQRGGTREILITSRTLVSREYTIPLL